MYSSLRTWAERRGSPSYSSWGMISVPSGRLTLRSSVVKAVQILFLLVVPIESSINIKKSAMLAIRIFVDLLLAAPTTVVAGCGPPG